mgnify:FL=1
MFKIQRNGIGFRLSLSAPGTGWRGHSVDLVSLAEAHAALDHYYGHCSGNNCPLCRDRQDKKD